jgi:hypothetical protein
VDPIHALICEAFGHVCALVFPDDVEVVLVVEVVSVVEVGALAL